MRNLFKRLGAFLMCMALAAGSPAASFAAGGVPQPAVGESAEAQYNEDADATQAQTNVDILVYTGVEITDQTDDSVIYKGDDLQLGISVEGIGPYTFKWEVSLDEGETWQTIEGADEPLYDITNAQYLPGDPSYKIPYHYRATVTDHAGHTDSAEIKVLVSPKTDEYIYRRIEHEDTGIATTSLMHKDTKLAVTPLGDTNEAYQAMAMELTPGHLPLVTADVKLYNTKNVDPVNIGDIELEFEVGDRYNGETVRIFQIVDGKVVEHTAVVENGVAIITVKELGQFMVESPFKDTNIITVSASEGGSVLPAGEVAVEDGEDKTFIITPDEGYKIGEVLLDGVPVAVSGNSYTLSNVTEDHTLDVKFEKIENTGEKHNVTVNYGDHGIVTPNGKLVVKHGESLTVSIAAYKGYTVDKITVNGKEFSMVGGYLTVPSITEDTVVNITFKKTNSTPVEPVIKHTITASAGKGGKISPSGENIVTNGGDMYFSIIPDAGYVIDTVKVDGKPVEMTDNTYHFVNVLGDRTIEATFRVDDGTGGIGGGEFVVISASSDKHGAISPSGDIYVPKGGSQTFHFTPKPGYMVRRVFVDGKVVAITRRSHTLHNVQENTRIYVEYIYAGGSYSTGEEIEETNFAWCWILLGVSGGVAALMIILIIIRRNKDEDDEVCIDTVEENVGFDNK